VHHFGVTFAIGAIEQAPDLHFKSFAAPFNCLSSLNTPVVINRTIVRWWPSYLLSIGQVNFLCDDHEPSQDDSHLTAALLSFFLQGVEPRNIVPRELIVVVDEVVRSLCPFAMLMDGFKLFALLKVSHVCRSGRVWDTPIRTAVRPTSFILVSMVENDCPTDCDK
jgi:hypothetical protein